MSIRPSRFKSFAAAALLALAAAGAQAQKEKQGEISYSYYLISCGNYIQHRQGPFRTDMDNTADTFYIAGWLSAYNRLEPEEAIPDDTTLDDVMLWLEQYCRENPLSNLEAGLFKLGDEIKPRHDAATEKPVATAPVPGPKQAPAASLPPHVPVQGLKPLQY
jgi:hypothetical protein